MTWNGLLQLHQSTGSLSFICQYDSGTNSQKSSPKERQGISWTSQMSTSHVLVYHKKDVIKIICRKKGLPVVVSILVNCNEIVLCNNNLFLWSSQKTGYDVNWSWINWKRKLHQMLLYKVMLFPTILESILLYQIFWWHLNTVNVNINCRS